MRSMRIAGMLLGLVLAAASVHAQEALVKQELAPTGTLRVAIAVGPAPSGIYALKDAATGGYRGVTIDLSTRLAEKLGVPIAFVPYLGSGDIQGSADKGLWDVTFMPVDDERRKFVDFGSPYHLLQSTYLVAPGSSIQTLAGANAAGVRIAGVKDTATFRASNRASPNATHIALGGVDEAVELMRAGNADALALGRASLGGLAGKTAGCTRAGRRLPQFNDCGGGAEGQAGGSRLRECVHRRSEGFRPGAARVRRHRVEGGAGGAGGHEALRTMDRWRR